MRVLKLFLSLQNKEIQLNSKEQKLETCRHICGWSDSTTCTLCGWPQCVEKYSKSFIIQGVVMVSCNLHGWFFLQIFYHKYTICWNISWIINVYLLKEVIYKSSLKELIFLHSTKNVPTQQMWKMPLSLLKSFIHGIIWNKSDLPIRKDKEEEFWVISVSDLLMTKKFTTFLHDTILLLLLRVG